jgi:hypothetical protein
MISIIFAERTISTKLPPQVELMRDEIFEYVVLNFVYPVTHQYTAHLHFFTKCDDIRPGFFAKVLVQPKLAAEAYAGLHFIVYQHGFVLVG